jgi:hypothetical protein
MSQSGLIQLCQMLLFDENVSFGFVIAGYLNFTASSLQLNMTRLLTMKPRTENKYRETRPVCRCIRILTGLIARCGRQQAR